MEDSNMLHLIMSELKEMRADVKEMRADVEALQAGQKNIRRDLARVERKIDRMSNDVGDTLAIVTEATDQELTALRKAK